MREKRITPQPFHFSRHCPCYCVAQVKFAASSTELAPL